MDKKTFRIGETVQIVGTSHPGTTGTITGIYVRDIPTRTPHNSYGVEIQATSEHLICESEDLEKMEIEQQISILAISHT